MIEEFIKRAGVFERGCYCNSSQTEGALIAELKLHVRSPTFLAFSSSWVCAHFAGGFFRVSLDQAFWFEVFILNYS